MKNGRDCSICVRRYRKGRLKTGFSAQTGKKYCLPLFVLR
ncbi:hypothetical protein HMPREF9123_2072 [Neisseria bacilliformis ATCC BAA-1200]|uniref:Uncharacterized protein n=1 Tax=Neisseria bacilliformis ATCC BAA-1200 TaxID=888742 RepID=F2BEB6_9NEIS|nr:hypothetical protein HMPREF9123_2072 [Neisseria bacilliformis ATCC BAA-1200]